MSMGTALGQACTPDPQYTTPGSYPATAPPACVGVPYSLTVTVVIPQDTVVDTGVFGVQTVPIDYTEIVNIIGLPPGLTFACEPANCQIPGGQSGCVIIQGTPTTAGSYPIDLVVEGCGTFIVQICQGDTAEGAFNMTVGAPITGFEVEGGREICAGTTVSLDAGSGYTSYNWSNGSSTQIAALPAGTHTVTVEDGACTASDTFTVKDARGDIFEPNDNFNAAVPLPIEGTLGNAFICGSGDNDWYTFEVSADRNDIAVTLTGLDKNLNLQILNASALNVGSSTLAGLANESVVLNNRAAGTYYIQVTGDGSDLSSSYNLNVKTRDVDFSGITRDEFLNEVIKETGIQEIASINEAPALFDFDVYPNPFTSSTTLSYTLSEDTEVNLTLYDVMGKAIDAPLQSTIQVAGTHAVEWISKDAPAGIYYAVLTAQGQKLTKKLILTK